VVVGERNYSGSLKSREEKLPRARFSAGIDQYQSCAGLQQLSNYPASLKTSNWTNMELIIVFFKSHFTPPFLPPLPSLSESLYHCTAKANKQERLKSKTTHPS